MFSRKKNIDAKLQLSYNGEQVKLLKNYHPTTILSGEELEGWEKVKEAIAEVKIYATFSAVDHFFERVILTGNSYSFINQVNYVVENYPVDEYLLVAGEVLPCTVEE